MYLIDVIIFFLSIVIYFLQNMMILTALDHLITLILAMLVLALGAAWSLRTRLAAHLEEEAAEQERERERIIYALRRGLN